MKRFKFLEKFDFDDYWRKVPGIATLTRDAISHSEWVIATSLGKPHSNRYYGSSPSLRSRSIAFEKAEIVR